MPEPLVSVVTPFYNTAPFLAESIESVLAQTYPSFEYLLVDNCSTDGSRDIARRYASRDHRIKLHECDTFLDQLPNFNRALKLISPASKYVKMVLADDVILPGCIEPMVAVAEREPSVGLVSSYYLHGERLDGEGIPLGQTVVKGREVLRTTFLTSATPRPRFFVGSPSTVLYRADLVRARPEFFTPGLYHPDTERAFELLLHSDMGFVHQVLSFLRVGNDGVTSSRANFCWESLDRYLAMSRFADQVLSPSELRVVRRRVHRDYFGTLGRMALRFPGRRFWEYHRRGLATAGRRLRWSQVLPWAAFEAARVVLNPADTIERFGRWRTRRELAAAQAAPVPAGESGRSSVVETT